MQFKVPQNIDIEDKIIGPLTMMQFIYLMVGGAIVYVFFQSYALSGPFWLTGFPVALITLAFSFVKVQDQPFPKFIVSLIFYLFRPKQRVWHKVEAYEEKKVTAPKLGEKPKLAKKHLESSELEKLADILDTGGRVEKI